MRSRPEEPFATPSIPAASPPARPMPLVVRLLGPVEVRVDGRPIAVDTRKAIAMLAYLAVSARPASREGLAALLWPDADDGDARGALRRTLSTLNAALGPGRLAIDRRAIALRDPDLDIDVRTFGGLVADVRRHGDVPGQTCPTCRAALERAVALDRGEFLAGFTLRDSEAWDEWQLAATELLRADRIAVLERLAGDAAAREQWATAVTATRRWLDLDPLHEPAHRLLIEAHARAQEPAAAIAQYRACVRILAAELGVAPLPETTALYEAVRDGLVPHRQPRAPAVPSTQPGPSAGGVPFVGRDAELRLLRDAAAASAAEGAGCLAVVRGEAGVGKSRLIDELGDQISAAGGRVLRARAFQGESGIAFGPIVELLEPALAIAGEAVETLEPWMRDSLGRLLPGRFDEPGSSGAGERPDIDSGNARGDSSIGPGRRRQLFEAAASAISLAVRGPAPAAVVVEDLQWADPSTLEAIGFLARRLADRPFLLVLSWRPEDASRETAAALVALELRPGTILVSLPRLDRMAVGELVRARVAPSPRREALADRLFAESDGLPLYLAEVLAAGSDLPDRPPAGMAALFETRLATVSEPADQVLAAAAVVGRSSTFGLVRQASGRSEEEAIAALEELQRRGLIREVDEAAATPSSAEPRYDFSHASLRLLAYERLGLARRRLLHRRVADALRQAGRDDDLGRLSLIAEHERQAGRESEAATAFALAGERARQLFAIREALSAFEMALALGHPEPVRLQLRIGELHTRLGDYPTALAALESAAAGATSDGPDLASIESLLGQIQLRRGDLAAADSHLVAALAALDDDSAASGAAPEDAARRSRMLADRSVVAHRAGDAGSARQLAETALELAREADDTAAAATAHRLLGLVARAEGDLATAARELETSREQAVAAGDLDAVIAADHALAIVEAQAGQTSSAIDRAAAALDAAARAGDRHVEAAISNTLADLCHAIGHEDESRAYLTRAVAIFADVGGAGRTLEPEIWKLVDW